MSPPPPAPSGVGAERGPAMAAGSGAAGASAREHRLEPGDTLPGLALRYGVTSTLLIPTPALPGAPCPDDEDKDTSVPSGDTSAAPAPSRHDLSATDFLRQLDAEIGRSKAAAAERLRAGSTGTAEAEGTRSTDTRAPPAHLGPRLGPRPLTRTPRAATLRDAEDEIFTL
ncbi:lysM and putative peptidoglycan-binding domain-containing protein 1 isoform X2 [Falco cherrug]|uniref:lysM and putative peptidoglycan-binding domain-containing protein 1 isoform X2 n=1 Tax=Falco cherrug TaxID=345164 RepID=UPI00247A7CBA|nr:lysM and putative peptidoglycan-binding domain-containing protein 1 isoform X2 [Falco cherrug]